MSVYCLLYILAVRLVYHHLVIFHLLIFLLNLLILIYLYLSEHATFKSISRIRGGGNENQLSHSRRSPGKVIVREKLVVGYWELIPMESGSEF